MRTHDPMPTYEDDGLSSDEGSSEEDEDEREDESMPPMPLTLPPSSYSDVHDSSPEPTPTSEVPGLTVVAASPVSASPETFESTPTVATPQPVKKTGKIPRVFKKRPSLTPASTTSTTLSGGSASVPPSPGSRPLTPATPTSAKRPKFPKKWSNRNRDFNFNAANDVLGIVMLEIQGATDLPKIKNSQ